MKKPTILIIRMGNTYRELSAEFGNFDRWIINAGRDLPVIWKTRKVDHVVPEEVDKYRGIILTGAHDTLTGPYPFMKGMERLLHKILEEKIPTLGICFGHQIIHLLLGGTVIRNPLGPAIGISKINLTLAGLANPLFSGLKRVKQEVYSSHFDIVGSLAGGVELLAWNDQTKCQACSYKGLIYTTQFHPEYTRAIMDFYIRKNYSLLKDEHYKNPLHIFPPEEILKSNKQIKRSPVTLKNFVSIVLGKNERHDL